MDVAWPTLLPALAGVVVLIQVVMRRFADAEPVLVALCLIPGIVAWVVYGDDAAAFTFAYMAANAALHRFVIERGFPRPGSGDRAGPD